MGIESLRGVTQVGVHNVASIEGYNDGVEISWAHTPIVVDHNHNTITFKIQEGTVKENGTNGVQVTELIKVARMMISKLNEKVPCVENELTLNSLDNALLIQEIRTKNRQNRGVEGTREV